MRSRLLASTAAIGALAATTAVAATATLPPPFAHSCWSTFPLNDVMAAAPSSYPGGTPSAETPAQLVNRVLRRFGDDRFVRRIELGAPPPGARFAGYWRLGDPPDDALWAYISAPESRYRQNLPREQRTASDQQLAAWEVDVLKAGLRDEFCAARGHPLAGWSVSGELAGRSDGRVAFLQRFASPSERVFRRRLAALSARYGFGVVSLRFLRPFQAAPLVVVETDRDPREFASDVGAIQGALDPRVMTHGVSGHSYEGFFFEARDADGAFLRTWRTQRSQLAGGEWAACRSRLPYGSSSGLVPSGRQSSARQC